MKRGITCCLRIISDGCITKCDLEEQLSVMLWETRLLDFSKSRKLWVKLVFPTIRLALSSRLIGVLKFQARRRSFWSRILLELNASPKTTSANTGGHVWRVSLSVWVYPLWVWLSWLFFTLPLPSFHYLFCIYSVLIQASTRNGTDFLWSWTILSRCHISAIMHIRYLHWESWQ